MSWIRPGVTALFRKRAAA